MGPCLSSPHAACRLKRLSGLLRSSSRLVLVACTLRCNNVAVSYAQHWLFYLVRSCSRTGDRVLQFCPEPLRWFTLSPSRAFVCVERVATSSSTDPQAATVGTLSVRARHVRGRAQRMRRRRLRRCCVERRPGPKENVYAAYDNCCCSLQTH